MLQPCDLELHWRGEAQDIDRFEVRLDQPISSISASGAFRLQPTPAELKLDSLVLSTNRMNALALSEPVAIRFVRPQSGPGWHLESEPLRMSGPAGELTAQGSVQWPDQGSLLLLLKRFPVEFLRPFIKAAPPVLRVRELSTMVNWSNGPANFHVEASGAGLAQLSRVTSGKGEKQEASNDASISVAG